jgi:hypothetical protein
MDISSIVPILYFACMTVVCGIAARRLFARANEQDSTIEFVAGIYVVFLGIFSLGVLIHSIIE